MNGVTTYRQILNGHPALIVIMLSVGGHMVMNGAMAPMLSLYASAFGVTEIAIGFVITVFGIGRLLADIPAAASGCGSGPLSRASLQWARG
jgi:hypothetical protein